MFDEGEPPLLKSLLKNEFFLSKLFGLPPEPLLFMLTTVLGDEVVEVVVLGALADSKPLHSVTSPSASFTCLSALAASFLDNRSEPPLEDKLRSDFLEIRSDWDLSRLKELFGDCDDDGEPAEPAEPASPGDRF